MTPKNKVNKIKGEVLVGHPVDTKKFFALKDKVDEVRSSIKVGDEIN